MAVNKKQAACGVAIDREHVEKDNYYATPAEGTRALLAVEKFEGTIWEPACGEGHISKVLIENGHHVISTDLVDRGYGQSRVDFLMEYATKVPNIITNPPFKNATDFIKKALELSTHKVAFLLRLQALEGAGRAEIYQKGHLSRVHVFKRRLTLLKNGSPIDGTSMLAMAWFVFDHDYTGKTELNWI